MSYIFPMTHRPAGRDRAESRRGHREPAGPRGYGPTFEGWPRAVVVGR